MATARVGDIGFIIEHLVTTNGVTPRNISGATVKEFHAETPAGVTKTWTADFTTTGADGLLRYVTIAGDLDEAGDWAIQAYVEDGGTELHSTSGKLTVGAAL